jgi:hypothetical protein
LQCKTNASFHRRRELFKADSSASAALIQKAHTELIVDINEPIKRAAMEVGEKGHWLTVRGMILDVSVNVYIEITLQ